MNYDDDKWDTMLKVVLTCAALYFLFHVGMALAQSPTVPTIQCWNNGFGTIQCAPI